MDGQDHPPEEPGDKMRREVVVGEELFTEGGESIGTIRGIDDDGLVISTAQGAERLSIEHSRTAHEFASAELMWRCMNCGEMGEIEGGIPADCPGCGVPREQLMYWTED